MQDVLWDATIFCPAYMSQPVQASLGGDGEHAGVVSQPLLGQEGGFYMSYCLYTASLDSLEKFIVIG